MRNVLVYDKCHKYDVIPIPVEEGIFFDQK